MNGVINIRTVYRYVDAAGAIKYHVTYSHLYDYYYENIPLIHPYGGYRLYYRPRPAPPRAAPAPRPHQYGPGRVNPPRQGGGHGPGGGNHGGGHGPGGHRR